MDFWVDFDLTTQHAFVNYLFCGPHIKDVSVVASAEEIFIVVDIVINNEIPRLHRCSYPIMSEDSVSLWTSWSLGSNKSSLLLCLPQHWDWGCVVIYQMWLRTTRLTVLYILDSVHCYIGFCMLQKQVSLISKRYSHLKFPKAALSDEELYVINSHCEGASVFSRSKSPDRYPTLSGQY